MTFQEITKHPEILAYYDQGNEILTALGYTDHSVVHTKLVAEKAADILRAYGYDEKTIELARIAGFLHDIGNSINRTHHAEYGAILANEILKESDMSIKDRVLVVSAIANHDESTGSASNPVAASLIIADKSDVRRSRVREKDPVLFDIHDRVNYAVTGNNLKIDVEEKKIALHLNVDEAICSLYEYFDIFLGRMTMCQRAARAFESRFSLKVNGQKVL